MVTCPKSDEEMDKRLLALAMNGSQFVCFDNAERVVRSESLAKVMTARSHTSRLLGKSEMVTEPWNAVITITGNNVGLSTDLTNRFIPIRIDAKCERPEERSFEVKNLEACVLEQRPRLVIACLRILRWAVSGDVRCQEEPSPFGGFEEWGRVVRMPLIALGYGDPVSTLKRERLANDTDRESIQALHGAWHEVFEQCPTTAQELVETVEAGRAGIDSKKLRNLKAAIEAWVSAKSRDKLTPTTAGYALKRVKDRIVNGRKLISERPPPANVCNWRLVYVSDDPSLGHRLPIAGAGKQHKSNNNNQKQEPPSDSSDRSHTFIDEEKIEVYRGVYTSFNAHIEGRGFIAGSLDFPGLSQQHPSRKQVPTPRSASDAFTLPAITEAAA
jgi:putative DNA primase/helicase